MDSELLLVTGLVLGAVAIPSTLSALNDGRPPRAGAVGLLLAGTAVAVALQARPGGYELADIPQVFSNVIGRFLN
ncbi:hypothetical protein LAZ29_05925 [Cereibacter sphaeroides]|uniref:hypothetical protein n=1 Tax=Rhodobacterales TaxID=204455 RepID=UPI000BBE58C9|nr:MULTISPECIES: hypothetical protein [Paracoccaceae]MCE6950459.1 hypothetical protein [Cereibacter sphaeroides]